MLEKNDTIYKAQVAIMEITEGQQENMNKLHFGIVNRAIGLNRKGVFLWKITFGPCGSNHLQHFDGYETSSVQWNAVVTLEEIRIMLENTNLNEPTSKRSQIGLAWACGVMYFSKCYYRYQYL